MELHLDRELSNKRIFPLWILKKAEQKRELLYHPDELTKIYSLRRSLKGVPRGSHGDVHPTGSQNQKQPRVPHGTWPLGR